MMVGKGVPFMAMKIGNDVELEHIDVFQEENDEYVGCSVGIMAYNEEANIARTIHAVLSQKGPSMRIEEIIVVASGCTDRTVPIVSEIAMKEPRVHLCIQEKRE